MVSGVNFSHQQPVIAITSGEPSGIGPDICLDLAGADLPVRIVVLGDKQLLEQRAASLGKHIFIQSYQRDTQPKKGMLEVCHIPVQVPVRAGLLDVHNADYVLQLLNRAYAGIEQGEFAAMVTAPVHKGIINDSGIPFSGHTEYLAAKSDTPLVVMMLAGGGLKVALATTHLPLRKVADALTAELLTEVLIILHRDLQHKFGLSQPRILVAGLNPHAGENGHLGHEENTIITPVIKKLQQQNMQVSGPFPADTLFQPFMLKEADAVLAMYHDQGLPVLKYASFGEGVNITLGLPFIRTSVDHGTALDLAGTGKASSGSLFAAVSSAIEMCHRSKFE
ncbi:4-hydroxythreonine-4-phosphate dehydrogenase PdxA [Snodgrassella sp. B3800]|uniref:4-hydroxythreonine-4-phosphate dehydrogenase PdxA n=1 Tax=Snodgrassella sp. B3800 TaxID=2818039 RepID=UPI00226AC787|nr:4-hydroxythreonine-4-phosphate dehydrogenase PdxA [Snodgrassella sp. B3800]MCX8746753.1 4-hydroxythreonine-4-phosphate dehydrogenase PdxA [Snodgrassella sp. B3800]